MNTPAPAGAVAPAAVAPTSTSTSTTITLRGALDELAARLDGRLVIPGDAGWDEARAAWNLAVDQRPVAVVVARSAIDVARTVDLARSLGLGVAPQATGHNAGPLVAAHGLADVILLRTHELRGVRIDAAARVARVEAGALWGDVVEAAAPHGLAPLAGSSHDVGVVGYTLGGGVSWLARSQGLAANRVLAAEVVTADGRIRRIDAEHESDLFWAIRGGGGDFAVVTALEFGLLPIAEAVAGTLFFPLERADEVLHAWARWTRSIPDTVTSVGRVLRFPALPELPPFLAGKSFAVVEVVLLESAATADGLLEPLRALGPDIDTVHLQPIPELLQLHMDPPGPTPGIGGGLALADLPDAAVDAFLDAVGPDSGTLLVSAEIRQLGGRVRPDAARAAAAAEGLPLPGVVAGLDAGYLVYGVGIAVPEIVEGVRASIARLVDGLAPWHAELDYLNFVEDRADAGRFFGDRLEQLRHLKRAVDPTRVIRSNHAV
ncbi:FAD-binding protein [Agromyces sp. MMS24-JH15]|uniref:FAD-dependent oxidoreductase n=1 Tax=Agromyces sp. MMS24-JH15 TaxID=3243765 RepID=UPI003747B242